MEAARLNGLLDSFHAQADLVKNKLTNLLVTVSDGRVPGQKELQSFHEDMDMLVSEYGQIKSEAQVLLSADEMPKEGSKAAEYVEAVENSRSRIMKLQFEKAEGVLRRFLQVKSFIKKYEDALLPFQEKAAEELKELSAVNIDQMLSETEAPELFLKALETENISVEGFKILEEIKKYYPEEVQWGLVGKHYFIDESREKDFQSDESFSQLIDNTDAATETITRDDELKGEDAETERDTEKAIEEEQIADKTGCQGEILTAKNKVKSGMPSAASFKKEIIKIARNLKETRDILPLMTNLGVLTKEQIYLIGVCMDCFEESDRDREKIDTAVELLAHKGYLACFVYEDGDRRREAYCLSAYCYGCLKKDSISVQMRGFWGLSFGNTKVVTSSDIKRSVIEKFIRNNDRLTEYLYTAKALVEPDEYQTIKQSITWKDDHYQIAVVKDGNVTNCYLYDPENHPHDVKENGILSIGEETKIDDVFKASGKQIFVCGNQSVSLLGQGENDINDAVVADVSKESEQVSEQISVEFKEEISAVKNEVKKETIPQERNEISTEKDNAEGAISVRTLLKKTTTPTDEEFCTVISYLLNREATTKEQLESIISQTIAFAKAAGDVAAKGNRAPGEYVESYRLSAQLRLASNLMLNECAYTSKFLSSVFSNPGNDDAAIKLSAYMFAMLTPGIAFDFGLKNQTELFLAHYEEYFRDFADFKPLFNKLMGVKDVVSTGFSPAFVSLLGDEAESEKFVNGLRTSARECLTEKIPRTKMRALPQMYSTCFGPRSDLYGCMEIINENRRDQDDIGIVKDVLGEFCDERDGVFSLSSDKIERALDEAWSKVNSRSKFKLEYGARDQVLRQYSARLEIMRKWVEHIENRNNRKHDISRLKTLRSELIKLIQDIQKNPAWKSRKNANILLWALSYMQWYLNGQAVNLEIYSEFVYSGIITVGDDGVPVIEPDLAQVKYYEPWRNVLRHIVSVSARKPVAEIKSEILGDTLDDKESEEGLKDNLHQLEMLGRLLREDSEDYIISDGQLQDATASAKYRATRFQEKLEMAYAYNQINETEKENLIGIVHQYQKGFYDAKDFACWRRFLEALEAQMAEIAMDQKKQLRGRLDACQRENPDSSLLKEADRLLEEEMNFAVTEEYINRFESGETELDKDVIPHDSDYFSDFIEPSHFDPLMNQCNRFDGKSLSTFGQIYVEHNMPREWTSRQREDSRKLVINWPRGKFKNHSSQIQTLFAGLGFEVKGAERIEVKKEEVFKIDVRRVPKSMADYRHPIASFGTQLKSPINAILLYGNYTAKQLVDTISNLDLGGISIVLLDRPVHVAYRRSVGEIFHTQTSGQNPFLLIDQVLFLYLALHQTTERMPAMLQCTLPFSTYQPFVRDGGSTSDEMFCGRTQELATIIDPNGACVVYGGRQLGKTALLERAESRCSKPDDKQFAVYTTIPRIKNEKEVVKTIVDDINKKCDKKIELPICSTIKEMCTAIGELFRDGKITSMLLLIDEVDDFLASIADMAYVPIQPLVDLKRETKNNFKFVIAGLHNVCRAKNATRDNGIFGQLGTPLCIKPLSPTDALQLISKPLRYLGFQIDRYSHLETILTNTNYYPGILQFFGYMLVETLTSQYSKYYHAADGNPPFTLQDEQLGAVMNSSDLNKSIKDKFRLSLELDQRYFMIARCITMLYYYYEDDRKAGSWQGFSVGEIKQMAEEYSIHCLEKESPKDYVNLLDEMVEMGILGKPGENRELYRLRRNSFADIIGENLDRLEEDIVNNNEEVCR